MPTVHEFRAILGGSSGDRPLVELPFDVRAAFGSARPKVVVTVNGVALRTTVSVYGGRSYVGFRKEIQEAAGIAVGQEIAVRVEADLEERVVEAPPELAAALAREPAAKATWDGLAFTHRREYAQWITGAKREETRAARAEKAIAMLRDGTRHP